MTTHTNVYTRNAPPWFSRIQTYTLGTPRRGLAALGRPLMLGVNNHKKIVIWKFIH